MKKQISVVIAIAVLMLSSFAALRLAYAQPPSVELVANYVELAYGSPGGFFDVEVWINDVTDLVAWEAVVYWDPSVMTRFRVTFENTMGGTLDNYTKGSMGGEYVRLGQVRTDGGSYTGTGHVATIEMIMKYPGASRIYIFDSTLLDSGLVPIAHDQIEDTIKSVHPAAIFSWYATEPDGVTPASALPDHYLYDDCQELQVYKIIWFDSSASYDVCNLVYNPVTHEWEEDVGYPDIVEWQWTFGDGYQSNDIRLYNSILPMGVIVREGDPDVSRPMVHFLANETHDETIMPGDGYTAMGIGALGMWEGVYVDLVNETGDPVPNGIVDVGDWRKIPSSMFPSLIPFASSPVLPGDPDIGLELVAFDFYEKHTEGYYMEPGIPEDFNGLYVNDEYDDWEFIYKDMQFYKDEGFCHVSVGTELIDHVFTDYNYDGYEVILKVYDSEGDYWQTNWKYGGSSAGNIVKLWRDVAIVSIWPSIDWWDGTEFEPDFGEGMQILVTVANYGTVHEWVKVYLYYVYEFTNISYHTTPTFGWETMKYMEGGLIETWEFKVSAGLGSGWALYVEWTPPKEGFYKLLATVEIMDALSEDQDTSNNYMFLSQTINNLGWTGLLTNPTVYAGWYCDLDHSGKVGPRDFYIFARNYGQQAP